jgi:predicted metalloprotease with PDZ domain
MQFPKFGHKSHDVHYQVKPSNPQAHYFTVKLQIAQPEAKQQVYMPAWIPGSYKIRDFSQYITWIKAYDKSGEIKITQIDKGTWQLAQASGQITIEYQVYAYDLSVRGSYLDTTRGFFNGPSMYLAVKGQEQAPCSVDILAPEDKQLKQWRVATALETHGAKSYGFGKYHASDYDELIDHPVEMGEFDLIEFDVMGVPHAMAITGKHRADTGRLAKDLKKVCTQHARMFGGVPKDIKKYIFLTTVVGEGYGGLEHRSSCSLIIKRENLPHKNNPEASDKYAIFLSLCSHEYFHTWNVKRIKPASFLPYDLSTEGYTRQLWVFDVFTDYYEDVALVRAGVITLEQYFKLTGDKITKLNSNPGYQIQSITDSSFCCWTKFYNPNPDTVNMLCSYYTKGCLIAWCIDTHLRQNTENTLDDVMRRLWKEYGEPCKGVPEGRVEEILSEVGGQGLHKLLQDWLYTTEDIPLFETARTHGIQIDYANDLGDPKVLLGIRLNPKDQTHIVACYDGSCAKAAGISAEDRLVAIDNLAVKGNMVKNMLSAYHPGDIVPIHVFRNDELLSFDVELADNPPQNAQLKCDPQASNEEKLTRENWLKAL